MGDDSTSHAWIVADDVVQFFGHRDQNVGGDIFTANIGHLNTGYVCDIKPRWDGVYQS